MILMRHHFSNLLFSTHKYILLQSTGEDIFSKLYTVKPHQSTAKRHRVTARYFTEDILLTLHIYIHTQ